MRIFVVSDTHRHRHELLTAAKSAQPVDMILHGGDETADALWLAERTNWPVIGVAGNWDTASDEFPLERMLDVGPRLLFTHGHRLRVKDGLQTLGQRAVQLGAAIVVFGHTHVATVVEQDGVVFLNPGSLAIPRGRRERTYALLEIAEERDHYRVDITHCELNGRVIADLVFHTKLDKSAASP